MPDEYPDFPSAAQMRDYLRAFAAAFGLAQRIECDTLVTDVAPLDESGLDGWQVEFADGKVREYAGVVIANGHYWDVNVPSYPGEFTGKQYNSLIIEKTIVDVSQQDSRFLQFFPSSELTGALLDPGTSPTFTHHAVRHG